MFPVLLLTACVAFGELPPELPGEEITQDYINQLIPKDTIEKKILHPRSEPNKWLKTAMKTWEAPSLTEQQSSERRNIPIGKGGIFIPRYSKATNEPKIEIIDPEGRSKASGKPGRAYSLQPGIYYVMLGSGSHSQRIVRKVTIEEGRVKPLIPDWGGLIIETVDENSNPFRGAYELIRIDEFDPYGRGFGADPVSGEDEKTWILKPGIYKILGVGEGYNSLSNFVTVRILPGELVRFLLIQEQTGLQIMGGGTIDVSPLHKLASNWKYGANIGGSITLNAQHEKKGDAEEVESYRSLYSLLTNAWLRYEKDPYEWESKIRLDEGFSFSGFDIKSLTTDADAFRLTSLFIWRFLPWVGPYGNAELNTNFLSRRRIRGEGEHLFYFLDKHVDTTKDETHYTIDTTQKFDSSQTYPTTPSFSPISFELGVGANVDLARTNFFESKLRGGFGSSFSNFRDHYNLIALKDIDAEGRLDTIARSGIGLYREKGTSIFEFGPQAALNAMIRIGRFATADGEIKVFAPIVPEMRFMRPDFDLTATLSWQLTRAITLDYDYHYLLKQPEKESARLKRSTHRVWLRFSYTNR